MNSMAAEKLQQNPSDLAMVPFVSVENMMNIVNRRTLPVIIREIAEYIEEDFQRWESFDKTPRVAAHSSEGVIELMPTSDGENYGFKYVNGHPANMARGYQTVTAFGVLARVDNGYPILVTEMTICLLYTSPSPRDRQKSRMPSSA